MLRKRIAGICVLASSLFVGSTVMGPRAAQAQVIDLDDEEDVEEAIADGTVAKGKAPSGGKAKGGEAPVEAETEQAPVVAGQMTEAGAAAKRMFDKQKWAEAALGLHRVVAGDTGD